ncbi:hypothetical protein [Lacrimispora xylanisolvens]
MNVELLSNLAGITVMGTAAATIVVKISGSQVVSASAFHLNKIENRHN